GGEAAQRLMIDLHAPRVRLARNRRQAPSRSAAACPGLGRARALGKAREMQVESGPPKPAINAIGLNEELAAVLAARFRPHRPPGLDPEAEVLVAATGRTDAAVLERMPRLRLVATFGAGYDHVDVAALRERRIMLANTPGLTDACVADFAMGLLIAV